MNDLKSQSAFNRILDKWREANLNTGIPKTKTVNTSHVLVSRVRPVLEMDEPALAGGDLEAISVKNTSTVVVHNCEFERDGITPAVQHKEYALHGILGPYATAADVYQITTAKLVETLLGERRDCTLICYGQTGSGKTYTVDQAAKEAIGALSQRIAQSSGAAVGGGLAYRAMEMLGSKATSLLSDERPEVQLLATAKGQVVVSPLSPVQTSGAADCLRLFRQACARRRCSPTERNPTSSRSHAFHWFHLPPAAGAAGEPVSAAAAAAAAPALDQPALLLVDLAGSESTRDSLFHDRQRQEETAAVNMSLMALKDCMREFSAGSKFINFRADKLTHLLRRCFLRRRAPAGSGAPSSEPAGGARVPSTTCFVACVSPLASDVKHSGRTLAYASQLAIAAAKKAIAYLDQFRPGLSQEFPDSTGAQLIGMSLGELQRRSGDPKLGHLLYDEIYKLKMRKR